MPQVEFILDGKEAGAVRAWLAFQRAQESVNAQLAAVDLNQLKIAQSAAVVDAQRNRGLALLRSIETEEEKYQRLIEETQALQTSGALSEQQALKVLAELQKQKHAASAAGKAESKAAADAAVAAAEQQKQAEAELLAARRQGVSLLRSIETEEEKYQRLIEETQALQTSGALSEQQAARVTKELQKQKHAASAAGKAEAENERQAVLLGIEAADNAERQRIARLKEVEKAEEQRGAAARRVLAEIATPQQRYNERLRELTALRQQNLLTERQYERAVRSARQEFEESGKKQTSLFDGIGAKIGVAAAGYLSVSAAVGGIRTALGAVMESNQKFIQQAEEAGAKYDKIFRQYRIQAGLGKLEGDQAQKSILQQAEIAGFTEERAGAAATALVSAGVAPDQASGGALEGFLATLNAQGLRDSDPSQYADAMTAVLQSNGMEVNAENMTKLGTQLQSAPIKETKLKLTNLPQLASVSAGLSGAMTQQEQLATYAVGGSAMGSFDKMATSMADITKNLRVAASKPDAVEYLAKIKLKPSQVDFVGEDFGTVMKTLKDALDKAPEELRTQVLAKVIEGSNVSAFNIIQNNMGKILDTAGAMDGADAQALYQNDVAVGSSGIDAARARQDLRRNRILAERDTQGTLLKKELEQQSLSSGEAPLLQDIRGTIFDKSRYLGADDATAAGLAEVAGTATGDTNLLMRGVQLAGNIVTGNATSLLTNASGDVAALNQVGARAAGNVTTASEGVGQRLGSSIEYQNRLMEQQLELQRKQLELQKRPAVNDIRPNLTPAGPVPSAANDARRP